MNSSILVIGAGASGLSAANELLRNGFKNVKIYEARDRLGGRIFSKQRNGDSDSSVIELGAQWIHGQVGNPVYEICKEEGLLDESQESLYAKFYHWRQIDREQNELVRELAEYFHSIVDKLDESSLKGFCTSENPPTVSLFDYLRHRIEADWLNKEENADRRQTIRAIFDWFVRFETECCGGDISRVSAKYFELFKECEGNPTVPFGHRGYHGFLSVLLRSIPPSKISLQVEVTNIDYTASPIKVTTTIGREDFDFVICTIPLGVLKGEKVRLFTPQLPESKIKTIDALGFGLCNKIFLEFESKDVFWESGESIQILWMNEVADTDRTWVHSLSRFDAVERNPKLLVAWAAGESSRSMESDSDEEVLRKCHEVLCMVMGREVPKPIGLERSKWFTDSFSRGSYTYISTVCESAALLPPTLAEPLEVNGKPGVCFAGEASSMHHFSTVHGAFESGLREARRIIKHVQKHQCGISPLACK